MTVFTESAAVKVSYIMLRHHWLGVPHEGLVKLVIHYTSQKLSSFMKSFTLQELLTIFILLSEQVFCGQIFEREKSGA